MPAAMREYLSTGKSHNGKNKHRKDPYPRSRPRSISTASYAGTAESCLTPIELKDSFRKELDRYNEESDLLSQNEWLAPPDPRGSTRRISPREFNEKRIRDLKRWSTVEAFMYGTSTSTLRDTDTTHPPQAYRPGTIFSAAHHNSTTTDYKHIQSDDPNLTATPYGTVYSKYRKMIVVGCYGEHCTYLPIYTHNGQGLDNKEFLNEYVSIRDVQDPHPFPDEGPNKGLRAVRDKDYHGTFIAGKACVKLTEIHSHRYDTPATIEGRLDVHSDSRRRLLLTAKSSI